MPLHQHHSSNNFAFQMTMTGTEKGNGQSDQGDIESPVPVNGALQNNTTNRRRASHAIIKGGWKSKSTAGGSAQSNMEMAQLQIKYKEYPLLVEMIIHENARTAALEHNGRKQIFYTKSNDGWFRTLFVIEGRALDRIIMPWMVSTINAIVWTVISEEFIPNDSRVDLTSYETFFALMLNSSLAFLLVFRLNRSAERYWDARTSWGTIVAHSRCIISDILVHGDRDPKIRDDIVKWIAAFSVGTMQFIRGFQHIEENMLAGILNDAEARELESKPHPGLYAADKLRGLLKKAFLVEEHTPLPIAYGRIQHLQSQDALLNGLILQMGALERIRATPLPLVYVSHLRTFLICFLLTLPYIWEGTLGYATIPMVFLTAFALLGLEGAAQEVESPFRQDRTNHLGMDSYCLLVMSNMKQQMKQNADREILDKAQLSGSHENSS